MDKKDPKYESLKSKLLKLSMLADSGEPTKLVMLGMP